MNRIVSIETRSEVDAANTLITHQRRYKRDE